jgi:CRP/FNR family transcriptional regulator, cyclic AMP receptor protein
VDSLVAAHSYFIPSNAYEHPFSDASSPLTHFIARVSSTATYRRRTKLFLEGEKPRGIFILRTGSAKLTTCSTVGKTIVIRLAEPGDVLGLNAVVSNRPYAVTAEMMASGRVDFIAQDSLLRLMKANDDFAFAVAEQLSASYYSLHDALRSLGLASHPLERLAKLLLSWTSPRDDGASTGDQSFKLPLTHQEIADNIGSTRQTVTKLFSELRRNHLLGSQGGELVITNRLELQRIVRF